MVCNKKSQGLPMNFIVLAAMAILVLIVVLIFFISGFKPGAAEVQTAINNCDSKCLLEFNRARTTTGTYTNANSEYCKLTQNVKGVGTAVKCPDLSKCQITRGDGVTCTVSCTGDKATC